jgi:hypothetical protein
MSDYPDDDREEAREEASEEARENGRSAEETDINVFNARAMKVFFEVMNNATTPSTINLQPLQKQLPIMYLAILNGHGDYGYGKNQRAFMAAPKLTLEGCHAKVEFPQLPRSTKHVVLGGVGVPEPTTLDVNWKNGVPHVHSISETAAWRIKFIQALDSQDVLLAIGIPVITNGADYYQSAN